MITNQSLTPSTPSHSDRIDKPTKIIRLDNEVSVLTPEYIEFQFRTVGPVRRAVAFVLDYVFICVVLGGIWFLTAILFLLLGLISAYFGSLGNGLLELIFGLGTGFLLVSFFVLWWFSGALQEAWYSGQTLGKRILKIKAVSTDGRAISLFQAMVRNFLRMADAVPLFPTIFFFPSETPFDGMSPGLLAVVPTFLAGVAVMILSRRMQRIGDICAGTMVIHAPTKQHEVLPVFDDQKLLQMALEIPNSFTPTASLTDALSLYVSRRSRFHQDRLNEISGHLVTPLLESWGWDKKQDFDLVAGAIYLRCVFGTSSISEMIEKKEMESRKLKADPLLAGAALSKRNDDDLLADDIHFQSDVVSHPPSDPGLETLHTPETDINDSGTDSDKGGLL